MTKQVNLSFRHTDGGGGERYIVESVCCGIALFDYDEDGLVDIYFLNGKPLKGTKSDEQPRNALYRNLGNWHFEDVGMTAGAADPGFGLGVAVGDYDNDGDADLYLNNFGPNVLLRNNGDGTFSDTTAEAGVDGGDEVGAGTSFLDFDRDGDLDLYVSNYVDFTYENHVPCSVNGYPAYAGPRYYEPLPDILYSNNGDGTFSDVSDQSGIGAYAGSGMGIVSADFDFDGNTDVFVCNDCRGNFLFRNRGDGTFEEIASLAGTSYNYFGDANASMGVDCGDFNNDGLLDFYMTNYAGELPVLYQNVGNGFLDDVTRRTSAGLGATRHVTWGLGLIDFDNDTNLDIFIACGHLDDNVEMRDDSAAYRAKNIVLVNRGNATFENISDIAGDGLLPKRSSRGVGFDDLDNDGRIDVVVLNSRESPTVLRNESREANSWLKVRLRGIKSNRDGVGARVVVSSDGVDQTSEVHSGRGYQSHFGTQLNFGLAKHKDPVAVTVRWPSGLAESYDKIDANRLSYLVEGNGRKVEPGDDAR